MNGVRDASSFVDTLLFEYQFNQTLLTQKGDKRPLPATNGIEERVTTLFNGTIQGQDRELHTKLFQIEENRQLSVALSSKDQHLLQLGRALDRVGLFDLELSDKVLSKIAPVLSAFEKRVGLLFTTFEDFQHIHVMGELMLQTLMGMQPGLHLIVVSQPQRREVTDRMHMAYWRGVHTVFKLLVKDPSLHDLLIVKVLDLLQASQNWKMPADYYKVDYGAMQALLRLLALFPPQKVSEHLYRVNKLCNQQLLVKVKTATTQHIRWGIATRARDELVATFNEALAFLSNNSTKFANKLMLLRDHIKTGSGDPTNFIGQILHDCVKSADIMQQPYALSAYYLLANKICSINLYNVSSEVGRDYPSTANLLGFVMQMPHQLPGRENSSPSKIIVTTVTELQHKGSEGLQQLLARPVRSIFYHGYNRTFRSEWMLLYNWMQKIHVEIKQRYPTEPVPFRAGFTEQFDQLKPS